MAEIPYTIDQNSNFEPFQVPDLSFADIILIVGAVYVDLDYELPTEALKSSVDTQLFCEPKFRIGGTGFNQASIFAKSISPTQKVELITLLGQDPVSALIREMVKASPIGFSVNFLDTSIDASPPVVSILREKLSNETSRRIMVGPPNRYISALWPGLSALDHDYGRRVDAALVFDGYSLTSYSPAFEAKLRAFTDNFSSSTLLLLPHQIHTSLGKEDFSSALSCFGNLESSFYTVSRIVLGIGDTGIPDDDLIVATIRELSSCHPRCELNLRFGALDAQYCAHYEYGSKVQIIEYEIDHLGKRSVGDQLQVHEMVDRSALVEKHRRELLI